VEWNGSAWNQIGSDIVGEDSGDIEGFALELNDSGNRILTSAIYNDDGPGSDAGQIRAFEWNGSSWSQIGDDVLGASSGDQFGFTIGFNDEGNKFAGGSPYHSSNRGLVRVYELT